MLTQELFQCRDVSNGPLVVPGDIIGGGDGGKALCHLGRIPVDAATVPVLQVPQEKEVLRLLCRNGGEEGLVPVPEFRPVEVAEDHDPTAVEPGGEIRKGEVHPGEGKGVVSLPEQSAAEQARKPQQKQPPSVESLCHGRYLLPQTVWDQALGSRAVLLAYLIGYVKIIPQRSRALREIK